MLRSYPARVEADGVQLPRSADALARAGRLVNDQARREPGAVAFQDYLPCVLDALASVGRMINEEGGGLGIASFSDWYKSVPVHPIVNLRHAELKRLQSHSVSVMQSQSFASNGTFRGRPIYAGDHATWWEWFFDAGPYDGQRVLDVLLTVLADRAALLAEAERRLATP